MRMINCPGHKFQALTFDGKPLLNRWKCVLCGLKVSKRSAAEYLEGKES